MEILKFENVKKIYKIPSFIKPVYRTAIENINFSIKKNTIVGLLGLNGAGKTTIIKLICGLIRPTSGKIYMYGKDISNMDIGYKAKIGYLPELPYFYPYYTPYLALKFYASLSQIECDNTKIDDILKKVNLYEFKNEKIKNFSKGMMQKLGLAQAIIHNPEFLVLDEPTSGLDPIAIKEMRTLLVELKNNSKTILLSSHSISEVEKICDEVLIISKGRIVKTLVKDMWQGKNLEDIFVETVKQ